MGIASDFGGMCFAFKIAYGYTEKENFNLWTGDNFLCLKRKEEKRLKFELYQIFKLLNIKKNRSNTSNHLREIFTETNIMAQELNEIIQMSSKKPL